MPCITSAFVFSVMGRVGLIGHMGPMGRIGEAALHSDFAEVCVLEGGLVFQAVASMRSKPMWATQIRAMRGFFVVAGPL